MLRLIDELCTSTDSRIVNLVNNLDIYIIPNTNPDGTYYGMDIQNFEDTYGKNGRFNYQNVAGTAAMNHIIYVLTGAKCDGEEAIKDTSRHFAILYRLEGAGTYCIDDQ